MIVVDGKEEKVLVDKAQVSADAAPTRLEAKKKREEEVEREWLAKLLEKHPLGPLDRSYCDAVNRRRQRKELWAETGLGGLIVLAVMFVWPVFLVDEEGYWDVGWLGFGVWFMAGLTTIYFAYRRGWLMKTGEDRKKEGLWGWGGL